MNLRIAVLCALVSVLSERSSEAANQYFMPGDAFFHSVLTEEALDAMDATEDPVFEYDRPEFLPRMLCGYAGFRRLKYEDMPEGMKKGLRQVYRDVREFTPKRVEITPEVRVETGELGDIDVPTGKMIHTEINGLNVLFYNPSFDRQKHRLALKYNEDWADMFAAYGHQRSHARLETFVPKANVMMEEWRDAAAVEPLKVKHAELTARNIEVPLIPESEGLVAIIIPDGDFERACNATGGEWGSTSFYLVTESSVSILKADGGHWKVRKP